METVNNFFSDLAAKMPFASDFFAKNLKIASFEINTLFLILVAAVVVILAIVIIACCAASAAKSKRKAKAADDSKKAMADAREAQAAKRTKSDVLEEVTDEDSTLDVLPGIAPEAEEKAEEAPAEEAPVSDIEPAQEVAEEPVAEEAPAEEPVAEESKEEDVPALEDVDVAPAEEKEEPKAEEVKPAPKKAPAKKSAAPTVATEENEMKKEPAKEDKTKKLVGTFEVSLCLDGYRFCLYASNKQLMYESVGFTSSEGAMKGIETFRKTLQECPFIITRDKYGRYRYVVNKRYQGENYTSAASAQSAAESVKRWAENAKVVVRNPKPEELEAYKKGLEGLRTKDDVDWDAVAKAEQAERKMGKFVVDEDGNQDEVIGYRFYLIANNAQILYTSSIYTTAAGALKAIDTFKRAVYVGNFYVDEDKFGHFRYILRPTASTTYVGESYNTRASAESSIESVKKFVKCAAIVPFKKGADEE